MIIPIRSSSRESNKSYVWKDCRQSKSRSQFNSPRAPTAHPPAITKVQIHNVKDIFLDTDDESRDSFDMNRVVSFNMERRYVSTLKACSDLNKIKQRMVELQTKLQERTNQTLNNSNVQQLIQMYKVRQLGIKSEFEQKINDLEQNKGIKDMILNEIINKNKVLLLEKNRHLSLLKKKKKNKKSIQYKDILDVIN